MSDKTRAERLKAALRENLKKRKAQARSRGEAAEGEALQAEKSGGAATEAGKAED